MDIAFIIKGTNDKNWPELFIQCKSKSEFDKTWNSIIWPQNSGNIGCPDIENYKDDIAYQIRVPLKYIGDDYYFTEEVE